VLGLLSKLFGQGGPGPQKADKADVPADDKERLTAFVRFVVSELVDAPDKVEVKAQDDGDRLALQVSCDKSDVGKVIGKRGRTIAAIRALVSGAARRAGVEVSVDVLD